MIDPEKVVALVKKLTELPPQKRRSTKDTRRELVVKHYLIFKGAYDRGYSYEELAQFFQETLEVSIKPETLRKYMSHAKKQRSIQDISEKNLSASTRSKPSTSKPSHYQTQTKALSPERKKSILSSRTSQDITNEFPNL